MNSYQKPQDSETKTIVRTTEEWLKINPYLTRQEAEKLASQPMRKPTHQELLKENLQHVRPAIPYTGMPKKS